MATITGLPADLDQYVLYSQTAQAEGLKLAVEHYRRRKPHCSGALVWQLNDCWPAQSWAYIDYYGIPKAAYYALRRAFAPVLASFRDTAEEGVELWVCNDTRDVVRATLTVRHESLSGGLLFEDTVDADVAAGIARVVWHAHHLRRDAEHLLTVRCPDPRIAANRHFFVPPRLLTLTARPTLSLAPLGPGRAAADISADGYVMGLGLVPPTVHTRMSDGHLDLRAGETVRLFVEDTAGPLDPATITARWFVP
jgi:beta-mannosidase